MARHGALFKNPDTNPPTCTLVASDYELEVATGAARHSK